MKKLVSFNLKTKKVTSIILGFLIGILLAEIGLRVYTYGSDSFSFMRMKSQTNLGTSGLVKESGHPNILHELKPNLDAYFKTKPFSTNSMGQRGKEYSRTKPENTIRIAVLGDSFTMGSGLTLEQTYPYKLEQLLNNTFENQKFEVINFGVGGYSLLDYISMINYKVRPCNPDLILVGFCAYNDWKFTKIIDNPNFEPMKPRNGFWRFYLGKAILREWKNIRVPFQKPEENFDFVDNHFSKLAKEIGDIPCVSVFSIFEFSKKSIPPNLSFFQQFNQFNQTQFNQ